MKSYEHHHVVGFAETNLVGNVYYVNHLAWQGRCRELFLRDHAPQILDELRRDLRLVTIRCSCDYIHELFAFDEIVIRMRLGAIVQNRVTMSFEYFRRESSGEVLVARGEQEVGCMRVEDGRTVPTPVPEALRDALRPFGAK